MKLFQIKTTAALCALLLGVAIAGPVSAAPTAVMPVTLKSIGALNATQVTSMQFGSIAVTTDAAASPNDIVLVKSPLSGIVTKTDNGTAVSAIVTADTTRAQQTVQITGGGAAEDGTVIQLQHGVISQFTDTDVVLSAITYLTSSEGPTTLTVSTNSPMTITDGTAAEEVYFGGTVTISGPFAAASDSASFTVTYAY